MPTGQAGNLVLRRGISVPQELRELAIEQIVREGLTGDEPGRRYWTIDLRGRTAEVFDSPERYQELLDAKEDAYRFAFACGDTEGATYYALEHNRSGQNEAALVLEISIPDKHCFVDSRDFLSAVFQFWDRKGGRRDDCRAMLAGLYGSAIVRYFDRAAASEEHSLRIAMCNLAAHDPQVISAHYENQSLISGRYGVSYHSAFGFRLPVPSERILSVSEAVTRASAVPDIRLIDWT